MKKIILLFCAGFTIGNVFGQVGIGTVNPSNSSMLDVSSTSDGGLTYKGFMPPRVPSIAARNTITPNISEAGLLVFVMNNGNGQSCLQIWDGGVWNDIYCVTIPSPEIWINEFHYDNNGPDLGEFIEIAGPAGYDLSNCTIELYNGVTGTSYETILLNGIIPNQSNGVGTRSFVPIGNIQNGPTDGIAIINAGVVIQFLSYEGIFTATSGPANGITSTDIGVLEDGTDLAGLSLQLTGTGNSYVDFLWNAPANDSPGNLNVGQNIN